MVKALRFAVSAFRHNLTEEDFFECFEDEKQLRMKSRKRSYVLLASNGQGEILHIAFRLSEDQENIYVFHGRPATLSEKRRYRFRGK